MRLSAVFGLVGLVVLGVGVHECTKDVPFHSGGESAPGAGAYDELGVRAIGAGLILVGGLTASVMFALSVQRASNAERRPAAHAAAGDDPRAQLLERRSIAMLGPLDESNTEVIIASLLFLDDTMPGHDIELRIDSPGGALGDVMAICDTIRDLKTPVSTVCTGRAVGGAALVLAAGKPGARRVYPRATVQLVPLTAHLSSAPTAMQRATAAVLTTFAHATGRTEAEIADVMAAHRVFDAQDARAFGLIDVVQEPLDGMTTVRR